jgi:hypothetical protein
MLIYLLFWGDFTCLLLAYISGVIGRMNREFRFSIAFCIAIILLFTMIGPVSANVFTINPGDSIQTAINNNVTDGGTLVLNPGIYYENDITVSQNIIIEANTAAGGDQNNTIIDGIGGQFGIFRATGTANSLTLNGLTLQDGYLPAYYSGDLIGGGAIYSEGEVTVISSAFSNCTAEIAGGAIYSEGEVTVTSSTFSNCSASWGAGAGNSGGAIYSEGEVTVTSSTFSNCSINAISASDSNVTVTTSTFSNCSANGDVGGAISAYGGTINVSSSTFSNCSVSAISSSMGNVMVTSSTFSNCGTDSNSTQWGMGGGAIYASSFDGSGGNITVNSSTFSNCLDDSGGAIYGEGTVNVSSSSFSNCSATGTPGSNTTPGGGAIDGFTINVSSSTFSNCSANGDVGGAIDGFTINVSSSTFANCSAGSGGYGGAIYSGENVTITNSTISNCSTSNGDGGGAIYSNNNVTLTTSTISNCSANGGYGGAISVSNEGSVTVTSSIISNCTAVSGGAIASYSTVTLTSSTFSNCLAMGGNGGAIDSLSELGYEGNVTAIESTFSNCSATCSATGCNGGYIGNGGAIYSYEGNVTAIESTFSNCLSATTYGSAIYSADGAVNMHFSRIYQNSYNAVETSGSGNVDDNWWGSNSDPWAQVYGATYSPWLVLGIIATPASITPSETSTVQVNLTYDSTGNNTVANGNVPDGIPITYGLTGLNGSLQPMTGTTLSGINTTIFTPTTFGVATITSMVDGQQVSAVIVISGAPSSTPTVTAVMPTAGTVAGGTSVTITGTGFTGATNVTFGTTAATSFTVFNDSSITATSPAGPAGTVDVTVTTTGGTSAMSTADQYTYTAIPAVAGISPTAGPQTAGTSVTITGSCFAGVTNVTFGTTPATSFTVNNAISITATAPAHAAGTVNVLVTTPFGTSAIVPADQFTYEDPPTVTKVNLNTGPLGGGTSVTITGTNLIGATQVYFGGIPAASYVINGATQITATTPGNGAGTVNIVVTTPVGTSATVPADQYTYEGPPSVTKLSPNTGPLGGGTSVTITGTNLLGATQVYFGGTPATSCTVISATTITAKSPAVQSGSVVVVTVITPSGTSAIVPADQFTYTGSTQSSIAVTRSMPATVMPGANITVTLTPGTTFATSPGWGVTETLPANWTFVSTTADSQSVVGGAYQFAELSATPITYTITAPSTPGTYTFNGTYIDGNKGTGTVVGAVSVTVKPNPLLTYDTNHNGYIEKSEAIAALTDYLFNNTLSKADCVTVITAYLFDTPVT